ncbi:MAG: vitamin K epoxide reductase family protein [Acidimicrobiales bacterium]
MPSLGLANYAATLALATTGNANRHRERPWLPLALAAKIAADAASGVYLTVEQASKHRQFCSWCLVATAAQPCHGPTRTGRSPRRARPSPGDGGKRRRPQRVPRRDRRPTATLRLSGKGPTDTVASRAATSRRSIRCAMVRIQ